MGYLIFFLIVAVILVGGALGANNNVKQANERRNLLKKQISGTIGFNAYVSIIGVGNFYQFAVDKQNRNILYTNGIIKKLIPFDKIINVELSEDNAIISSKSLFRTVGGGVVGGILGGGAGTVVGGLSGDQKQGKTVSNVQVKIRLRDIADSSLVIECFNSKKMTPSRKNSIKPTDRDGYIYKEGLVHAKKICDIIGVIIDEEDHKKSKFTLTTKDSNVTSTIEELEKLVNLKEKGILNEEEFLKMKADILSNSNIHPNMSNVVDREIQTESEIPTEIIDAISCGQSLLAMKLYKDYKHCGLKEAKYFIENYK